MSQQPSDVNATPNRGGGSSSFLPSFCGIQTAFAVILGAQLLALILTLAAGWSKGEFWQRLSLISYYVQLIAVCSAAILCVLRRRLARWPDPAAGFAAWAVVMLVTAAAVMTTGHLEQLGNGDLQLFAGDAWTLLIRSLGISGIAGALILRYLYLHGQWRRQVLARSEARFQALQARIRPHFLFNSMNTVASLTRTDPALAETVVQDLADLFRASLSDPEGGSDLGRELELIRRYLEVEQIRLGDRLRVEWDLEELPENAPLPLLMLQPLVENAVYHGVEPALDRGVVRIAGRYRENRVNLSVRNSLPPEHGQGNHRSGNQMALESVRQRLQSMYPGRCSLTLGRVDDEFQVRLVFPYP
jgi:two-component system sensor histidine kinase AlgZ